MSVTKVTDAMRNVTQVDASKITTGTIPDARIQASGVTQHVTATDLTPIRQDLAMLALYNAVSDNRAAYNLPSSFIDQFEDDTGITTQTNVDRLDDEYVASVYTTSGKFVADSNTVLLVDFETDPVTDASASNHTLTATGTAARVSNAKKFGSYCGKTGNGTWSIPSSSDFAFGTGDFTIEFWINVVSWAANADKQIFSGPGSGMGINIGAGSASSYQPYFHVPGDYPPNLGGWSGLSHTGDGADNAWFHYAYTRASGTSWAHSNGVRTGTDTDGSTHNYIAEPKFIGAYATNSQQWDFYIDELRVTKGLARYGSGNFTPQADIPVNNATGTLISDTQTASSATTKMSGVILYKDNAGTASLGTDLKIYLSANNGGAWTEAASYGAVTPLFSTGVKMVRLGETTVTSGTAPVIKAVWANQAASSKETQLHGWAMNY